jgi:formate dehydrogenase subunit gamma
METDTVQRYGRAGRWFHAGVYLTVLVALATGWWFVVDGYRRDSPLARLVGVPDGAVHEYAGYGTTAVFVVWLPFGARGIAVFVRETLRWRRGDGRWLANWPRAVFSGNFGSHDGHFDPGQRLANVVMVLTLAVLVLTGLGMLFLPELPVSLLVIHRWATFLLTPVLLGHIAVAAGVLPGYRGVWRSMHLGGRLPVEVARRLWPDWLDRRR